MGLDLNLDVREMRLDETELITEYFLSATPEHLQLLGVDRERLPPRDAWAPRFRQNAALPLAERRGFFVIWLADARPIGFSSCDQIVFGDHAFMHLHVTEPTLRQRGVGTVCVRRSVEIYFAALQLKRLFCEPNAYNTGPNRTLQSAGFRYVKTHDTVPGPINFHQAVTRWVFER